MIKGFKFIKQINLCVKYLLACKTHSISRWSPSVKLAATSSSCKTSSISRWSPTYSISRWSPSVKACKAHSICSRVKGNCTNNPSCTYSQRLQYSISRGSPSVRANPSCTYSHSNNSQVKNPSPRWPFTHIPHTHSCWEKTSVGDGVCPETPQIGNVAIVST